MVVKSIILAKRAMSSPMQTCSSHESVALNEDRCFFSGSTCLHNASTYDVDRRVHINVH